MLQFVIFGFCHKKNQIRETDIRNITTINLNDWLKGLLEKNFVLSHFWNPCKLQGYLVKHNVCNVYITVFTNVCLCAQLNTAFDRCVYLSMFLSSACFTQVCMVWRMVSFCKMTDELYLVFFGFFFPFYTITVKKGEIFISCACLGRINPSL